MKKIKLLVLFLLLMLVGCTQNQPNDQVSSGKRDVTEEDFKKPLVNYFEESKKADNNDNVEIFNYSDIPNRVVDEYVDYLTNLNIKESMIQGEDGQSYNYEYTIVGKQVKINIIRSIVTGNKISLYFEKPIAD